MYLLETIGRPKSKNPRAIRFTFRMTQEESDILDELSLMVGTNRNDVIRKAIYKYYKCLKKTM